MSIDITIYGNCVSACCIVGTLVEEADKIVESLKKPALDPKAPAPTTTLTATQTFAPRDCDKGIINGIAITYKSQEEPVRKAIVASVKNAMAGNTIRRHPQAPPKAQGPHTPTPSVPPLTPSELLTLNILIGPNPLKRALQRIRKRTKK